MCCCCFFGVVLEHVKGERTRQIQIITLTPSLPQPVKYPG